MITIVGIGALGSHLIPLIRGVGEPLRLIDFDHVEDKNIQSQFHAKGSIGKLKVQAMQQVMAFLWGTKVETVPHKLVADNVEQLLGKSTPIVDCLDNGATRRLVQAFARKTNIPCLHGALAANGAFGRVVWTEQFKIDDEADAGAPTCEDGNFLPFINLVSSYMAMAVQAFIKDGKKIGFHIYPSGAQQI